MPRRVVIHAGFHKTGTSTLQQTLRLNRPLLKPLMRFVLRPGMKDVVVAARGYSGHRDELSRAKFHHRFGSLLYEQPAMTRRVLCLSAEELSGHLPGRPGIADYRAVVDLAQDMVESTRLVFPRAEVMFFFTTRAPDAWLESAWSEHVKSSLLTQSLDEFATRNRAAADLDAIVDAVADAVDVPVERARLEDQRETPFGPATPLLDLCEVPAAVRRKMTRPAPANQRLDDALMAALLEANRTIKNKTELRARKQEMIDAAKGRGS
jgi:hypothetical protein